MVLKESIDRVDFAAATTAFVGALFVTRPAFIFGTGGDVAKAPVLAVFCALGGAMTQAIVYVTLRKLHAVDHVVAIHYFFSFGTITSILTILFMGVVSLPAKVLSAIGKPTDIYLHIHSGLQSTDECGVPVLSFW